MSIFDQPNQLNIDFFRNHGWEITFGFGRWFAYYNIEKQYASGLNNYGQMVFGAINLRYDGGLHRLESLWGCYNNIENSMDLTVAINKIEFKYDEMHGVARY